MSTQGPGELVGDWDLQMSTPVGRLAAQLQLRIEDGQLVGAATSRGERVPLRDITTEHTEEGLRARWRQSITKPLRLTLDFDVLADGSRLEGFSQAGRLPRSTVTGTRVTPPSPD